MTAGAITTSASNGGTVGSLSCNASGSPVACTLASGATSGTYVIDVTIQTGPANDLRSCITANNTALTQYGTTPAVNSNTDTVMVTGCANPTVSISKTDDVNHTVAAGGNFN